MAILDSKGRLFGKLSILDLGAALVILLVIVGIFFFPGTSGSVAQVGVTTKPIEVDLIVRGLNVRDPQQIYSEGLKEGGKTNIIIRNQPYGQIEVKSVKQLPRTLLVPQPDGSIREMSDPRANQFNTDMLLTLNGKAQITSTGPVLGNSKLKIGMPVELEGFNYNFNATVIDVRT
ncbi:DUF4330 domain-containing protein [Gloeocapsopsis crepidinum LEGE 06123]|uniref:DUF4330 domain-containing protein n=1 Tax=Gloeocapsopsis crepidinum LEGE 06123 TaxID=588587 RepID=A0ABR9UM31_9CHRO|nr:MULTISPECIES: DUF4330 domain-containing protein [Gloeocapsopsis]MBE9189347.1 DUF4330 domain-containing protein [Gloeocapsopsis crepidinum LEGE 06123]PIG94450.1 pyruvate/2-oxoglutarate dehydrogenase complex,dihydrolipoamide dehydrogenase (E3) component [Gloeocapsopsis sp. IPPAS B-1203]